LTVSEKRKVLISEKKLNHLFFKANTENSTFKILKRNYNFEKIYTCGLIDYLEKEFNYPEGIILFGSFAKGEENEKSDIDMMIISPLHKTINLKKFEHILHHPIHLFVYSSTAIEKLKKENKGLLNNIINGIVLYGFWEFLK